MPIAEQSTREKKGALCNCNRRMLAITAASLLFLLTIIWSATLWDIARSEKEVQSTVEITTRTLARALSEHMLSTIKRLELAIKELDAAWTPDQNDIRTEAERLKKIIGDLALQISIVEPNGLVAYSTLPHIAGISIADREHFSVHPALAGNSCWQAGFGPSFRQMDHPVFQPHCPARQTCRRHCYFC